jgi:hypothetical protein
VSNALETPAAEAQAARPRRLPGGLLLVALLLVVIAVLVLGLPLLGVLYGIVNPPTPPLPPRAQQIAYSSIDYGVDEWEYASTENACAVLQFYIDIGASCRTAPMQCREGDGSSLTVNDTLVGRCFGREEFSIFAMQYEVVIARLSSGESGSRLRVNRETFWLGGGGDATLP